MPIGDASPEDDHALAPHSAEGRQQAQNAHGGPMTSLLESRLTAHQHALIKTVLVAQTESLGLLEAPIVENLLARRACRRVLDIGCGEGSFLLKLARKAKGAHFLGIDHSSLAIDDALGTLRRGSWRNVEFRTAFFDPGFERAKYDAILTR